jgi:hypothetical protein
VISVENTEDELQAGLLATPVGLRGSGRVRYAAAMYFYQRRMISEDILEVYRACSKNDLIDPKSQA